MNPYNRNEIWNLLCQYTEQDYLRKHHLAVEAAMRWYARQFGEDENAWGNIGLIHDFEYEKYPEQHPQKGSEILAELGFPEDWIYAIKTHGDHMGLPRPHRVDKTLYAVDELTGLILAVALVRPSKKLADVDLAAVKKKWKDKAFARGANREQITRGAEELGIPLDQHIQNVLEALQQVHEQLGV
ncbi:MAG: HDIG domain-containing metalloprotein [Anaerolineae bacterium]